MADAHILYIGALGGTLPLMNLGIQSKIVFVFEFVFVFVFVTFDSVRKDGTKREKNKF